MFIRIAKQKRGDKVYRHLQIAESFRDPEKGGSPRTRILAHLGTIESLGEDQVERLIAGLQKALGRDPAQTGPPLLTFARDFGHVHAVHHLWDALGLSKALDRAGVNSPTGLDYADLIKLLVVNRLCDPCSKLALLDWLDGVWLSGFEQHRPAYHHLLRAMDRLLDAKDALEPLIAKRFMPKSQLEGDLLFYDITSTWFDGDRSLVEDDIRRFGYSRDGRFDRRQVTIGVVMGKDSIPLCHHVFPGNTVDKTTVVEVVKDLKTRFKLRSVVFVGDRGMLSDGNLETLLAEEFGFIVAHPLRRGEIARSVIEDLRLKISFTGQDEEIVEEVRDGVRFVLAYSPKIAVETKANRQERLAKADAKIREMLAPKSGKGRKPSPQGQYDRIRDYLRDKGLLSLFQISLTQDQVTVKADRKRRTWEDKIDGVLLLETTDMNAPCADIIKHYKELAEIERGWRALKSTLELRPVYHWTEERIRAHVFVCVISLQLERWMRNKLKDMAMSVPTAIRLLRQIKMGEIMIGEQKLMTPSRPTEAQKKILRTLGAPPIPTHGEKENVV
jgi:transposase